MGPCGPLTWMDYMCPKLGGALKDFFSGPNPQNQYFLVREGIFWDFKWSKLKSRPRSTFWWWSFGQISILRPGFAYHRQYFHNFKRHLEYSVKSGFRTKPHPCQQLGLDLKSPVLSSIPQHLRSRSQKGIFSQPTSKNKIFESNGQINMSNYWTNQQNHARCAQDTRNCMQNAHPQAQNNHILQRKQRRGLRPRPTGARSAPVVAFLIFGRKFDEGIV